MSSINGAHAVTPEIARAALANPGGWVYKIEGSYGPTEHVPPEAIVGAWKVGDRGEIVGEFVPNPNYREGTSRTK